MIENRTPPHKLSTLSDSPRIRQIRVSTSCALSGTRPPIPRTHLAAEVKAKIKVPVLPPTGGGRAAGRASGTFIKSAQAHNSRKQADRHDRHSKAVPAHTTPANQAGNTRSRFADSGTYSHPRPALTHACSLRRFCTCGATVLNPRQSKNRRILLCFLSRPYRSCDSAIAHSTYRNLGS